MAAATRKIASKKTSFIAKDEGGAEESDPKKQAEERTDSDGATKDDKSPTDPTVVGGSGESNLLNSVPDDHPVKVARRTPAHTVIRGIFDKPYLDDVNIDLEQQKATDLKSIDQYNKEIIDPTEPVKNDNAEKANA